MASSAQPGTGPAEEFRYPGNRLGLPEDGPGSVTGWGRRLLALLIDWLLAGLIASAITGKPIWAGGNDYNTAQLVTFFAMSAVLAGLAGFTLGHRICGLRVIRVWGWRPGIHRAARAVGRGDPLVPDLLWCCPPSSTTATAAACTTAPRARSSYGGKSYAGTYAGVTACGQSGHWQARLTQQDETHEGDHATLAAVLLLACVRLHERGRYAEPVRPDDDQQPDADADPDPTPTPKPKPKPKPKPVPKAKDGTNLAACRDGDCIVQVGSGRTTIKFSGGKLVITKVDAKFAYFVLTGDYGSGNGSLGESPATFGDGLSVITGPVPREQDPPGLTLRAPYVGNGRAIIDMHLV